MAEQSKYVKELTLTRVIDAPRERVWEAWTDPRQFAQWWGPRGFTNPVCEIDARPGGKILVHMSGFGMLAPMTGVFTEVVKPERLVYTSEAFMATGQDTPTLEAVTTVTFEDAAGKTRLTVHEAIVKTGTGAAQALEGMEPGLIQTLDKLAEFLR